MKQLQNIDYKNKMRGNNIKIFCILRIVSEYFIIQLEF